MRMEVCRNGFKLGKDIKMQLTCYTRQPRLSWSTNSTKDWKILYAPHARISECHPQILLSHVRAAAHKVKSFNLLYLYWLIPSIETNHLDRGGHYKLCIEQQCFLPLCNTDKLTSDNVVMWHWHPGQNLSVDKTLLGKNANKEIIKMEE